VSPTLASLIALQQIDSAADAARKRLADVPAAEAAVDASIAAATDLVASARARVDENQAARRALDRDVAGVDTRLGRFDDHKAAVKTNQEYTALLHEITTAKAEKDALEERILLLMEEADGLAAALKAAETALQKTTHDGARERDVLARARGVIDAELHRLVGERKDALVGVDARALGTYEQLLKGRKGVAVAAMVRGHCTACHVRLRPHFEQQIRRNEGIVQCENCQRILYFEPPPDAPAGPA
jgi:hypothetical protein